NAITPTLTGLQCHSRSTLGTACHTAAHQASNSRLRRQQSQIHRDPSTTSQSLTSPRSVRPAHTKARIVRMPKRRRIINKERTRSHCILNLPLHLGNNTTEPIAQQQLTDQCLNAAP